jgi:hypothetical protein
MHRPASPILHLRCHSIDVVSCNVGLTASARSDCGLRYHKSVTLSQPCAVIPLSLLHSLAFLATSASHSECTLDPDSLEPVAQLGNLRWLGLYSCSGITLASIERLFSTSVRGRLLKISVSCCPDLTPIPSHRWWSDYAEHKRELAAMHERVLAQRGRQDTPVLKQD